MTLFDIVDEAVWFYAGWAIGNTFWRAIDRRRQRRIRERWIDANVAAGSGAFKR